MTKENIKRYLISSAVTFATSFIVVLLAEIDTFTVESLKDGAIIGVLFTASRAGIKGILELSLLHLSEK